MIADRLEHAALYRNLGDGIATALDYLAKTDFSKLEVGRYELDGERVYAMVQEYESRENKGVYEAHRKYIDVQYVVAGREQMGFASLADMTVTKEYLEKDDYLLLSGQGQLVTFGPGSFAIFFPHDAHMPCIRVQGPEKVRKVVVKVAVDSRR